MTDTISILSEIRSSYNCFDEAEEPYYRALSEAIEAVKKNRLNKWYGNSDINKIYSIDFDGTLCVECWPKIGAPNVELINYLKEQKKSGCKLILNTCRERKELEEAVQWCAYYGLYFDAVNENLPELTKLWGYTRKIYADVYIDDHNSQEGFINLPFTSEEDC